MVEKKRVFEGISGIGPESEKKLLEAGITRIDKLASMSVEELNDLLKCGEGKAREIIRQALERDIAFFAPATKFKSEVYDKMQRITSGSKAIDELMGGGFPTMNIVTVSGEFGSGKTQLAMQLAVNVQLPPEKGGLSGKAVYIDTENSFSPARIMKMAEAVGLDPQKALENILLVKATNTDHIEIAVDKLEDLLENGAKIRLLVVDSFISQFRAEYSTLDVLVTRQRKMLKLLDRLKKIAWRYNILIYLTNQVVVDFSSIPGVSTMRPAGGFVMGHWGGIQIYLRRGKKRIFAIRDSPEQPERETVFEITEEGIKDVE